MAIRIRAFGAGHAAYGVSRASRVGSTDIYVPTEVIFMRSRTPDIVSVV